MSTALSIIAASTGVSEQEVTDVLKGMIISAKNQHGSVATNAEMAVVSSIFAKYDLNPFVKEGHAFVSGGKLQVMIGLDGWIKIANRQPDFDGYEQFDNFDSDGKLISVTTKIYVKNRRFPTPHTEYMEEAFQPKSDAWKKYQNRMLAGKSLGQCVRKAFGISEVVDDDEASRIRSNSGRVEREINPPAPAINLQDFDDRMATCIDQEELKIVSSGIRQELEQSGAWQQVKAEIILMNRKHSQRIEESQVVEFDVETGEATENMDEANEN